MTLKNRAHDILIRRSGCAAVVALLWATGLVAQAADQPELLVNPGFEEIASGQPAGWEASDPKRVAPDEHAGAGGSLCVKLDTRDEEGSLHVAQNILEPKQGQKFVFRYRVCGDVGEGTKYQAYVGIWKGTEWLSGVATEMKPVPSSWEENTIEFKLTQDASRLMVVFAIKGDGGAVWFDDASLRPVDE